MATKKFIEKGLSKMQVQVSATGFIGKVIMVMTGVALLAFIFMLSIFVLIPIGLLGVLVLGSQYRKMKRLRKHIHQPTADGHIIEGEIVYEEAAAKQLM